MSEKSNKLKNLAYLAISPKWYFMILAFTLITLSISFSAQLHAKQLSYKKFNAGSDTTFSYQWRNKDTEYKLKFDLNNGELANMPNSPANYNEKLLQDFIYSEVMRIASEVDPTRADVDITRNHDGISFSVRSRQNNYAQQVLKKLKQTHKDAQQRYWERSFIASYTSPTGQLGIRHDHARYSDLSRKALLPIVDAIKAMQINNRDTREFIGILLSWVQSIPYSRLENRLYSNGAGFVSPRDLLVYNQGDCDSKATLMAAILKAYSDYIDVKMVYLPDHALLALAMPAKPKETTVVHNGTQYVLLEPTGPAQYTIGEVADSTNLALLNRQYDLTQL